MITIVKANCKQKYYKKLIFKPQQKTRTDAGFLFITGLLSMGSLLVVDILSRQNYCPYIRKVGLFQCLG